MSTFGEEVAPGTVSCGRDACAKATQALGSRLSCTEGVAAHPFERSPTGCSVHVATDGRSHLTFPL